MKFEHMDGPEHVQWDPDGHPYSGFFVRVFCGPETIVSYGGSATRQMLSILAASGWADLMYEEALALKAWLNANVE